MTHARFIGIRLRAGALYARLPDIRRRRSAMLPAIIFRTPPPWSLLPASRSARRRDGTETLRWRYLGVSPLTEDNVFRSPPISTVNGRIGYGFDNGWRIYLDVLNLFNSQDQPDHLRLWLDHQERQPLRRLLLPRADRAGGRMPERRHGLCSASDGALGGQAHARRSFLVIGNGAPFLGEAGPAGRGHRGRLLDT